MFLLLYSSGPFSNPIILTHFQVACLQEMAVLFACLKTNDFLESNCLKEITTFKGCYKTNIDKDFSVKQTKHKNIAVPGKDVTYKQLNKYMRMYPTP